MYVIIFKWWDVVCFVKIILKGDFKVGVLNLKFGDFIEVLNVWDYKWLVFNILEDEKIVWMDKFFWILIII